MKLSSSAAPGRSARACVRSASKLPRYLLTVSLAALTSCSLFVDTASLATSACAPDRKLCGDICVSARDAGYGCGDPDCNPCGSKDNGGGPVKFECSPIPGVQDTYQCTKAGCLQGFAGNYCEINLNTDADHCGSLQNTCSSRLCIAGKCST